MRSAFAALLTFALLTTSTAVYQCLDSAPHLYCCKNNPFGCQILRDPSQNPANPPGTSYQPADLAAFTAACEKLGGSWPACCYVDASITSCNRAFNNPKTKGGFKIANWGTLEGYVTKLPSGYPEQAGKK